MVNDNEPIIPGLNDPASIADMRRRHLRLGIMAQALAARALEELDAKMKAGQPLDLSPSDAKTLLDLGLKLERGDCGKEAASSETKKAEKPKRTDALPVPFRNRHTKTY